MPNYTIANAAEFIGRVNGSGGFDRVVPGDILRLGAGTLDCRAVPLNFPHGIYVVGAGREATTIQGQFDTNLNGQPLPLVLDGFTLDGTGLDAVGSYGCHEIADGNIRMIDLEVIGSTETSAGNCMTFVSLNSSFRAAAIDCVFDTAERDVISLKAPSGGATATNSTLQLFSCTGYTAGTNVNDQVLTPHDGATMEDFGGYYYDANGGQTVAADAPQTTPLRLYGTKIRHDGGYSIGAGITSADGIEFARSGGLQHDFQVFESLTNSYLERCEVIPRGTNVCLIDNNEIFGGGIHNEIAGSQAHIFRNLVRDYTTTNLAGIWIDQLSNTTFKIEGNVVMNCYRNYYFRSEGSPTILFRGNLSFAPVNAAVFQFGGSGTIDYSDSGYNHLSGTLTTYTAKTGDVTTAPTPTDIRAFYRDQGKLYRQKLLSDIRMQSEAIKSGWRGEWSMGSEASGFSVPDIVTGIKADPDLGTAGMIADAANAATQATTAATQSTLANTEIQKVHRAAAAVTAGGPIQRHLENTDGDTLETVYEVIDGDPA